MVALEDKLHDRQLKSLSFMIVFTKKKPHGGASCSRSVWTTNEVDAQAHTASMATNIQYNLDHQSGDKWKLLNISWQGSFILLNVSRNMAQLGGMVEILPCGM